MAKILVIPIPGDLRRVMPNRPRLWVAFVFPFDHHMETEQRGDY